MARYLFVSDPFIASLLGVAQLPANQPFQIFTDRQGGDLVTDITSPDGSTSIPNSNGWFSADGSGQPADFRGPNNLVRLWIDAGAGRRYPVFAADLLGDVLAAAIDWLAGGVPATGSGDGVTDHGALSGLGDDDHLQYHTDARGDARYYVRNLVDQAIAQAISASSAEDRKRGNHSGTQQASSISDFVASVQAVPGFGSGSGGTTVTWDTLTGKPTTFAPSSHTHPASQISDASDLGRTLLKVADAASARLAIGAGTGNGTSNLTLGSTGTTAAPGNHAHAASSVSFTPTGVLTATDVQGAIAQAASLAGVLPGYTHSITLAAAKSASARAAITSRTDIVIRVYGGTSTDDWTSPWLLDGVDYWDFVPSA